MENKLQQLTEKLYNEGLEKGRSQGQSELEQAQAKATEIIAQAKAEAAKIKEQALTEASELKASTQGELRLAAQQLSSELRTAIENIITKKTVDGATAKAWESGEFIQKMVLDAVSRFNPKGDEAVTVTLPQGGDKALEAAIDKTFAQGVEVNLSSRVKTPVRIAPKDGGYYVSLTAEDFNELFCSYIRPMVAKMLF